MSSNNLTPIKHNPIETTGFLMNKEYLDIGKKSMDLMKIWQNPECKDEINFNGMRFEMAIPYGVSEEKISEIITHFLNDITDGNKNKELIIVDPYFYPNNKNKPDVKKYCSLILNIFAEYFEKTENLYIITRPDIDINSNKDIIESEIIKINPSIKIYHRTHKGYHDRFYISDRKKGFLLGTSLNGVGNKFSVIMRMEPLDIEVVIRHLKKDDLVP